MYLRSKKKKIKKSSFYEHCSSQITEQSLLFMIYVVFRSVHEVRPYESNSFYNFTTVGAMPLPLMVTVTPFASLGMRTMACARPCQAL